MDWIGKILEVIKLQTKYIVTIFLVSCALLFLPEELLSKVKLVEFSNRYGLFIGIVILSSGILIAMELGIAGWGSIKGFVLTRRLRANSLERLLNLDPLEKSVLREFFLQGQNTIKLPIDNPVVAGLIEAGILSIVGQYGRSSSAGKFFNIKMSAFVQRSLTGVLIGLPEEEPTTEQIEYLRSNRPPFISRIEKDEFLRNW